ncbi:hypothetical protein D6D17_10241 [Aureobasidium pullulans]|nr:hypothetical protein D6D17_10241 [Aureobasidium pullulans]
MESSSLLCCCCAVKMLLEKPLKTVCNVKVQDCQNIPCNTCFLKLKEHRCVPLDTDAHLIFREIMRIKLEGHTDKFVQQRSWFLEDIEEALTKISKPAQPPTVGSTGWAGDEPFFIRFSAVPHKTSIDTSGSACPPTVEPVTTPSPVAYTTPVKASSRFQRSVDPGRHSYYSDCSRYSENSGVHEEIFYQHDEWVSYQRFERSRARPRTNILKGIKRTVHDLLDGVYIR